MKASDLNQEILQRQIREAFSSADRESKPFFRIMLSVRLRERPTWMTNSSGELEQVSDGLCEADRSIIATCEMWIREIYERAFRNIQQWKSTTC